MQDPAKQVTSVTIEDELKQSYLDYAMSVIVGRALPDVRDGLKPVHRRVLFAMHELNNDWNKAYKKSARIVGDVIGKYHPHGDTAVYDTIVRMAQPFSLRYMLVDGQGNFGSVDGDAPAAMRYTEVRMSRIAHALLEDLDKETVNFAPNYDGTEFAPTVLPSCFPNLLVNGSSGIAVGMATNIPPHNLTETVDACIALIDDPSLDIDALMSYVPGPDFPTAGIIHGRAGIVSAYKTGRGRIYVRAKVDIETNEKTQRQTIIVNELPYQVNKARLIEKIAMLVKEKKIEGISALRDESDKDGMRIVIELKRGEMAEVLLNNLYVQTQMQSVFGINFVALVDNQPKLLNLKDMLSAFIKHRREVVTRRTVYELRKARERVHILEGLSIALANIDPIIALIKASPNGQAAREQLLAQVWQEGDVAQILKAAGTDASRPDDLPEAFGFSPQGYRLSPQQAQAILDLKLQRLTGLERDKIIQEYKALLEKIQEYLEILTNPDRLMAVIRDALVDIRERFGDERRTEITNSDADFSLEDLINEEDVVVTASRLGYIKAQPIDTYRAQRRGGKGKAAASVKEEDFIDQLLIASTHDTILCFSDRGKVYWLKTYQLPMVSRTSRGKPLVNLLPLAADERISTILPLREFSEDKFVFMATAQGTVKKVQLTDFSRPRANGIIALDLSDSDKLIGAAITEGSQDVMLFSNAGKAIRFSEADVRCMGRTARGVRGIKLQADQHVIALIIPEQDAMILTATRYGYGKRTHIDEFRSIGRGGQGVIAIQTSERNGEVVGAVQVTAGNDIMLISDQGTMVRTHSDEVALVGRNTQGVRLINLSTDEHLVSVGRISDIADDDAVPEAEGDDEGI